MAEVPPQVTLKLTPKSRKAIGHLMVRGNLDLAPLITHALATFDALQSHQGDGATIIIRKPDGSEMALPSLWDMK